MLIRKRHFLYASPWIFAAAVGILLVIIIFFALSNMRREQQVMRENLFNRSQAVARMVGAGTRTAIMMGLGTPQVQHLIEQAAEEPDIRYLMVMDGNYEILAHSDPIRIGERLADRLARLPSASRQGYYRIVESENNKGKVFELTSAFRPLEGRGQGMMQRGLPGKYCNECSKDGSPSHTGPDGRLDWCAQGLGNHPPGVENAALPARFIVVGLDMGAEEAIIRQGIYHIFFISLALFLAGLGGWTALLGAQGFRTSQQTLNYMRIFSGRLISRLPLGVIATADPASPADPGRIKTFNPAAAALLGLEPATVLNLRPQEALPAPFAALLSAAACPDGENSADPASSACEQEVEYQTTNGRHLTLQVAVMAMDDPGKGVIGRVLLLQDVSERKRLEREMGKHERLLALGKMAAGVAHEVRNPARP